MVQEVIDGFVAMDSLLGQISVHITRHSGPTRIIEEHTSIDQAMSKLSHVFEVGFDVVRHSDIEEYLTVLADYAHTVIEARGQQTIKLILDINQRTNNVIDAKGKTNIYDLIDEMLASYSLEFDKEGKPLMPTFYINPETAKNLDYSPATPEQERRHEEILARKKAEFLGRKHIRLLS